MSAQNPVQEKLEQLGQARKVARAAKDFNEADRIRDQISALGWEIVDLTDGFTLIATSRVSITSKINQLKAMSYHLLNSKMIGHFYYKSRPRPAGANALTLF